MVGRPRYPTRGGIIAHAIESKENESIHFSCCVLPISFVRFLSDRVRGGRGGAGKRSGRSDEGNSEYS
jgi:hypothetical protein